MIDLRIASAPDALRLMEEGWPTRVISLVGDDLRFDLPNLGPHHFIARFHDVEAEVDGYTAPTRAVMKAALDHTAKLGEGERLLVHCHAGKSRSPAMSMAVLVQLGFTPAAALSRVKALRPFIIPNRLMIGLLDDLLGQEGELIRVVDEHYRSLPPESSLPDRGGLNR